MRSKTISGHYDTIFSIDHNNRTFVPKNVDQSCIPNNYNLICAGQEVQLDLNNPTCLRDFWGRYRELGSLYWEERTIAKTLEWERYQEHLRALRRISWFASSLPDNGVEALVTLFLLPLLIPCGIYLSHEQQKIRDEWESGRTEQLIRDMEFKASQRSLRDALRSCDREHGTRFLKIMDSVVTEMSQIAGNLPVVAVLQEETNRYRFATVEQIYSKVFQPAFETFQARQRPYRRYSGTYLEQIREKKNAAAQKGSCRENSPLWWRHMRLSSRSVTWITPAMRGHRWMRNRRKNFSKISVTTCGMIRISALSPPGSWKTRTGSLLSGTV